MTGNTFTVMVKQPRKWTSLFIKYDANYAETYTFNIMIKLEMQFLITYRSHISNSCSFLYCPKLFMQHIFLNISIFINMIIINKITHKIRVQTMFIQYRKTLHKISRQKHPSSLQDCNTQLKSCKGIMTEIITWDRLYFFIILYTCIRC